MKDLKTYFFTYGEDPAFPFHAGWSEVKAPSLDAAIDIFNIVHPQRHQNTVNCASFYTEEEMVGTRMYTGGNFGKKCVERIELSIDVLGREI